MKGLSIANTDVIREAHNSFARPEPFSVEDKPSRVDEQEAFHFKSYVPHEGKLYELDGLKPNLPRR
jgi:ubiquitin carboxyl-terminal hydrolase L5